MLIVGSWGVVAPAQVPPYFWYAMHGDPIRPLTASIDRLIAMHVAGTTFLPQQNPETLQKALARRDAGDAIIISVDAGRMLGEVDPDGSLTSTLGLEVINAQLTSIPFYVIAPERSVASLRGRQVRIGYYSAPDAQLDESVVRGVIGPLLGIEQLTPVPVFDPRAMARGLTAPAGERGYLDLAGVYDSDPSVFLDTFISEFSSRARAGELRARLVLLPSSHPPEPRPPRAPADPRVFILPYTNAALYAYAGLLETGVRGGLAALATERSGPADDYPVILTNVRRVRGERAYDDLMRRLGDIYYMALFEQAKLRNRCAGEWSPLYETYLLAAHVSDRAEPLKSLGLWGHLQMMAELDARGKERYEAKVRILERMLGTLKIPVHEPKKLADLLATRGRPTHRQLFSPDTAVLGYDDALDTIAENMQSTGSIDELQRARAGLVAAVFKAAKPNCRKAGNGLRSVENYDPYFHLQVVEALVRLRARR